MTLLLAPTKQMDFESALPSLSGIPAARDFSARKSRQPRFAAEAAQLNRMLSAYGEEELMKAMAVSRPLAEKTTAEISARLGGSAPVRPAIFAYSGTVFANLDAGSLGSAELEWAEKHLLILSGLYGMLRPFDTVSPYRLEMKFPASPEPGRSLTSWWKEKLEGALPAEGEVVSLASGEYEKALNLRSLGSRFIRIGFRERRGGAEGTLRAVGMYAKAARGRMLRRILEEKPGSVEEIKSFSFDGYRYEPEAGGSTDWLFVRDE